MNAHPPTSVVLFIPFAHLDYSMAFFLWNLISLALLAGSIWLVARELRVTFSLWSLFPMTVLLLLCAPLRDHLWLGQITLLILFLLCGMWSAERSGHPILAGVMLGAATSIKVFPGLLFLYYLLRGQWRTVFVGVLTTVALTILTACLLGVDTYFDYIQNVMPKITEFQTHILNASLAGLWTALFNPGEHQLIVPLIHSATIARIATIVSTISVLGVLVWAIRRARTPADLDEVFGLTVTAALLVSPVTWNHYYLLLMIPLALFWMNLRSVWDKAAFMIIITIFLLDAAFPYVIILLVDPSVTVLKPIHILARSLPCYALLGLFVLTLVRVIRSSSTVPSRFGGLCSGPVATFQYPSEGGKHGT